MRSAFLLPLISAAIAITPGCGGREEVWDITPSGLVSHGLDDAAAIVDVAGERVLMVKVEKDLSLNPVSVPIHRGFASSATTRSGHTLRGTFLTYVSTVVTLDT